MMRPEIIDLETPASWPEPVAAHLAANHDLYLHWETKSEDVDVSAYDRAVRDLMDALRPYAIAGWHCTRLTEAEIARILSEGMHLPNTVMLDARIDSCVADGQISPAIALRLKAKNESGDWNREGMLWFCFFQPRLAGESGIERFFRHWGGEALYNFHEDDPEISPVLGSVGVPCVVEAEIPVSALGQGCGLAFNIVRRFLVSLGLRTTGPLEYEGRMERPLAPDAVRKVHRFPGTEFQTLTGCATWRRPIGITP